MSIIKPVLRPVLRTVLGSVFDASAGGSASVDPLKNWNAAGTGSRTAVFWGDSTTSNATVLFTSMTERYSRLGDPLEGSTRLNRGTNGASLAVALSNSIPFGIDHVIGLAPTLIVACWGINDVRIGQTSLEQMKARLTEMVDRLKGALPNTDILLWTPNSFLTTDVNNLGLVVPNANAQLYTDILWDSHEFLRQTRHDCAFLDKQEIFGRVCPATSPLMVDQLHQSAEGNQRLATQAALTLAAPRPPYSQELSDAAWAQNPSAPWEIYPLAVQDPTRMQMRDYGRWLNQQVYGSNLYLIDIASNSSYPHIPIRENVAVGDYVQMGLGGPVWRIPAGASIQTYSTTGIRIANIPNTGIIPVTTPSPGTVTIYRRIS